MKIKSLIALLLLLAPTNAAAFKVSDPSHSLATINDILLEEESLEEGLNKASDFLNVVNSALFP